MTITKFRQELFQMADQALHGDPVSFTYRGVVFRVVPEEKQSKLDRLVGQQVLAPKADLEKDSRKLLGEMEAEWLKDWSEL